MCSKNVDLPSECFDDELNVLGWNSLDGFLDDMVAVLILDTLEDIRLKLPDKLGLLVRKDMFESLRKLARADYSHRALTNLLNNSAAVRLH